MGDKQPNTQIQSNEKPQWVRYVSKAIVFFEGIQTVNLWGNIEFVADEVLRSPNILLKDNNPQDDLYVHTYVALSPST